jgi:hypothetical protein
MVNDTIEAQLWATLDNRVNLMALMLTPTVLGLSALMIAYDIYRAGLEAEKASQHCSA